VTDVGSPQTKMPLMPTDTTLTRVRELREQGLTPKVIARSLGLPLREVAGLVAAVAADRTGASPVVGCWVSPGWSGGLGVPDDHGHPDGPHANPGSGLVTALVARTHRHDSVSVCLYLVDVYCLGVKNADGPRIIAGRRLPAFRDDVFSAYAGQPVAATLDLVRELVFGAVDFARGLGFDPHPDFVTAAGHLGEWTGPAVITFGLNGRPFYHQGPYDDGAAVMKTLERTVGRDGFHFFIEAW
jgi:hypothetical protein